MAWPTIDENDNQESSQTANSVAERDNSESSNTKIPEVRTVTFADADWYSDFLRSATYIVPKQRKIRKSTCIAPEIQSNVEEHPQTARKSFPQRRTVQHPKLHLKKINHEWTSVDAGNSVAREDVCPPGPSKACWSKEKSEKAVKSWTSATGRSSTIPIGEDWSISGPSKAGCSKEKSKNPMKSFTANGCPGKDLKKEEKIMSARKENSKSEFSKKNVSKPSSSTRGEGSEGNFNYSHDVYEEHFKKNVYEQFAITSNIYPKLLQKKKARALSSTEDESEEECGTRPTNSMHGHLSCNNVNIKWSNSQKITYKEKAKALPSTDEEFEESATHPTNSVHGHSSCKSNVNNSHKKAYKKKAKALPSTDEDELEECRPTNSVHGHSSCNSNVSNSKMVSYKRDESGPELKMTARKSISGPPYKKLNDDIYHKSRKSHKEKLKFFKKKKKKARKLDSSEDEDYNTVVHQIECESMETNSEDEIIFLTEKNYRADRDRICCVCEVTMVTHYCRLCTRKYCASNWCSRDHYAVCQGGCLETI